MKIGDMVVSQDDGLKNSDYGTIVSPYIGDDYDWWVQFIVYDRYKITDHKIKLPYKECELQYENT